MGYSVKEVRDLLIRAVEQFACTYCDGESETCPAALEEDELREVLKSVLNIFSRWVFRGLGSSVSQKTLRLEDGKDYVDLIDHKDLAYIEDHEVLKSGRRVNLQGVLMHPAKDISEETRGTPRKYPIRFNVPVENLRARCTAPPRDVEALCRRVSDFYEQIGGENNYLSVPPALVKQFGMLELFGSAWNTVAARYCSALEIERKHFGSLGSAFDYQFQSDDVILANPPFDEAICKEAVEHILEQLQREPGAAVVLVMPDWRINFDAATLASSSKHLIEKRCLKKSEFKFFNYASGRYVPVADVCLYHLGKAEGLSLTSFMELWKRAQSAANRR